MNKKKVVACLLAATMTAGMLAGCGGSSGSSDSSSSSSGGKDKLTFWFPTFASAVSYTHLTLPTTPYV